MQLTQKQKQLIITLISDNLDSGQKEYREICDIIECLKTDSRPFDPARDTILSWLMKQPGWLDGSGEYRSQAWFPLPDGRAVRVCSGEESHEPDLLVDLYDSRDTLWDTRYYKPR